MALDKDLEITIQAIKMRLCLAIVATKTLILVGMFSIYLVYYPVAFLISPSTPSGGSFSTGFSTTFNSQAPSTHSAPQIHTRKQNPPQSTGFLYVLVDNM